MFFSLTVVRMEIFFKKINHCYFFNIKQIQNFTYNQVSRVLRNINNCSQDNWNKKHYNAIKNQLYLDNDNKKRNEVAKKYLKLKGKCNIIFPEIFTNTEHVFHLFVIRTKKRSLLIKKLNEKNIFPGIHYPIPNHTQPGFKYLINKKSNLKITEKISSEILSLPIYPGLKNEEVKIVCDIIKDF